MPSKKAADAPIQIKQISMGEITVRLVGTAGLFSNRMSAKVKAGLLVGSRRKTTAEKAEIKHHPVEEYRATMLVDRNAHPESAVLLPATAFKSAMATAALVVEGVNKTDVQRLVYLPDEYVPVFGIPQLRMDVTRSADMNRTPDIRTRAYFPQWGTEIVIRHATSRLPRAAIVNLLHNAGIVCGVGDFRQEKGRGSYGTFRLLDGDEQFPAGLLDKEAQLAAIADPELANEETVALMEHYDAAVAARS